MALPIALDWDRPWQAWPLTPLFGGIAGYIVGSPPALSSLLDSDLDFSGAEDDTRTIELSEDKGELEDDEESQATETSREHADDHELL
ncbi:hypothetical protein EDB19DRAFT_1905264 [Suillus lakei]|nr:hypothetical protein EDB19DRAFT_1905264 [Suillus lakei]